MANKSRTESFFTMPAFARPFVTRSLRGPRQRRYVAMSGVLAIITLFVGMWLSLGSGSFEQQLRVSLGLEEDRYGREFSELSVYAHSSEELAELETALNWIEPDAHPYEMGRVFSHDEYGAEWAYYRIVDLRSSAWNQLEAAALSEHWALDDEQRQLSRDARALLESRGWDNPYLVDGVEPSPSDLDAYPAFDWHYSSNVDALRTFVDKDLQVTVHLYQSPMNLRDAIRLTGLIAGGLLSILLLVVAPVSAGVQQAQEVHENTLMPLRTTALSARDLSLGLAAGPLAVAGIIASPQLAIMLVCGAAAGALLPLVGQLTVLLVACLSLTLLAQLTGQVMGRARTPGMVGIALLSLTSLAWIAGLSLSLHVDSDSAGALALAPHGAALFALGSTFALRPAVGSTASEVAIAAAAVGTLGLATIGLLTFRALEHRVAEREGQVLTLGQGLIGALACIAMVLIAIVATFGRGAIDGGDAVEVYLVTLGFLAPVFAVFVTSQVPVGGVPRTRTVPVARILGALALALALHFAAVLAVTGLDSDVFLLFHPFALVHLVWALAVLGLLSIRIVSYPVKLTDGLLVMLVCGAGISAYVQGAMWAAEGGRATAHLFAFAELSPVLGLAQVAWMIAIPALLVRGLKRNLKAIAPAGEAPAAPAKPAD